MMKYLCLLLSLFFPLHFVAAQSVTVGNISKLTLCAGDTVWVPYTSNGSFQQDNFFVAQLSDSNGLFTTFNNIGHFTNGRDSIPVVIWNAADHYRVRVIATDPYTISGNSSSDIKVFNYPTPDPSNNAKSTYIGKVGFVGDAIQFTDASSEAQGSKYLWSFDQDASITISSTSSPTVTYSSAGRKSGKLTVFNGADCSTTKTFELQILTCSQVIPESTYVVTGIDTGKYRPFVWVKTGASYTAAGDDIRYDMSTVFVESGASITIDYDSKGLYYIKPGASCTVNYNVHGYAVIILSKGSTISFPGRNMDTLYCPEMNFDYSQVSQKDVKVKETPLIILNTANNLRVNSDGAAISVSVVNLLGFPIASKTDFGVLNLDLSNFANGVYFAIINSGDHREMKKISVVH